MLIYCTSFYGGERYYEHKYKIINTVLTASNSADQHLAEYIPNNRQALINNDIDSEENNTNIIKKHVKPIIQDRPLYPKEVFLTFDDGPSPNNTLKVLDILNQNNIKATFFVIGKHVDAYPEIVKTLQENGMCILTHTYSHDYAIYKSKETYFNDLEAGNEAIKRATGDYPIKYVRLPGGSDNRVSSMNIMKDIRDTLKQKDIRYVDWNVSSGDAAADVVPMNTIRDNLLGQFRYRNFAVMLMHDAQAKTTSAEALPYVIKYLKEQGFVFRTFDDITPTEEKEMIKQRVIYR